MRKIVGIHSCRAALEARAPRELRKIYLQPGWQKHAALKELEQTARAKGLSPEILSPARLGRLAQSHQGVAVFADGGPEMDLGGLSRRAAALILDGIEDPKNLGAIVRTAWLMGAAGVFISRHRSAGMTPAAMKAASGGAEYVPVKAASLSQSLAALKKEGFEICGLDQSARQPLWGEKFEGRAAFVLGGERLGLRPLMKRKCDRLLSIPQRAASAAGRASYNVSVSAALALSEFFRPGGGAPEPPAARRAGEKALAAGGKTV